MSASDNLVTLKGGVVVPVGVLRLAWQLEDRGMRLRVDGDQIVVNPSRLLTDADREAIRANREPLKALINYVEVM